MILQWTQNSNESNNAQTKHFTTLLEAIHQSEQPIDGIVISTPTPTHASLINTAASHKISIFTEKPVDETSSQIQTLFNTVRTHNVALSCGFQRRFDPSYLALYETIRSGGIGAPLTANIFFGDHPMPSRQFLLQGGGNIISDCSAHDIDYIRWVLGDEVETVFAMGTSSDEELADAGVIDNATVLMKFMKGTVVTLTLSRGANYGYDQRCEVFGTNGMASVKNIAENSTELCNTTGIHHPKLQHSFPQRFEYAFGREIDAFADTVVLGKPWPVTEEDCIAVQRVSDAALESCESGQVVNLIKEDHLVGVV